MQRERGFRGCEHRFRYCPESVHVQSESVFTLNRNPRSLSTGIRTRLARAGKLFRICQGVYMRPIETRFGIRAPSIERGLATLSALWGVTIVPTGGSAANCLGLTTQNPVRSVYLTSGPSRRLHFGAHPVELRHAPRWQLSAPYRKAGQVIRALAWLGPEEVEDGLDTVLPSLSADDLDELSAARAVMPAWMAEPVSNRISND